MSNRVFLTKRKEGKNFQAKKIRDERNSIQKWNPFGYIYIYIVNRY